jgi:hypothetical protein
MEAVKDFMEVYIEVSEGNHTVITRKFNESRDRSKTCLYWLFITDYRDRACKIPTTLPINKYVPCITTATIELTFSLYNTLRQIYFS